MNASPARWVLTGGAGFLGTHFLQSSSPEEGEIIVISRNAPRWPVDRPWIRYVEEDVREVETIRDLITPETAVVHMASGSYPGKAEKMIESDIQDNVLGTVRLAQVCADRQARSFIFLSSGGAVYGNQETSPLHEGMNPLPISAYGAMKLTIEHYLYIIHHLKGLPVVSLRVGNCYGSWHPGVGQGAVNVFLKKILHDEPIEIWGDGRQIRDYVFAGDVCQAIRDVAASTHLAGYEVFNVGTGEGKSLLDVIGSIEAVTGRKANVSLLPARMVDVRSNILDIRKIRQAVGWEPRHDFESSLRDVCEWARLHI
jgi:UDP-glucose 4-epimerase